MIAIVNRDFPRFVFPYQYVALGRHSGSTGPFQLQQPTPIMHHPILAHDSFLLQPEDFVELSCRGPSPVIIRAGHSGVGVTLVVSAR